MPSRSRPGLLTLIASINLLASLLGAIAVGVTAFINFSEFANMPKSPPPEAAVNPAQGAPRMGGVPGPPGLPPPPPGPPPAVIIRRPVVLSENPRAYLRERQRYLLLQVPGYELYAETMVVVGAVLALLLLGSGMSLLALRPAGRSLAFFYALSAPLLLGASVAYTYLNVVPQVERWENNRSYLFDHLEEGRPPSLGVPLLYAGEGLTLFFGVVYPLVLVGALTRPKVRAVFRPEPAESPPPVEPPAPAAAPTISVNEN